MDVDMAPEDDAGGGPRADRPVLAAGATGEDLSSAASRGALAACVKVLGAQTRPSAEGGGRGVRRRVCLDVLTQRRTPCFSRRWCWSPRGRPKASRRNARPTPRREWRRKESGVKSGGAAARPTATPGAGRGGGDVGTDKGSDDFDLAPTLSSSRSYGWRA